MTAIHVLAHIKRVRLPRESSSDLAVSGDMPAETPAALPDGPERFAHSYVHPGPQDCRDYAQCHARAYGLSRSGPESTVDGWRRCLSPSRPESDLTQPRRGERGGSLRRGNSQPPPDSPTE